MKTLLNRRWLLATMLLATVVGAGYLVVPVGQGRVSQASCDKIQVGWTETHLDALLGGSDSKLFDLTTNQPVLLEAGWRNEDGDEIKVSFGGSLRATGKSFTPTKLSVFELAKRRIERRMRALWR